MTSNKVLEDVTPNAEFLIKSIAEQGYSLGTALADLIDNSISAEANNIEILVDTQQEPFILYLADNGNGMDVEALRSSMQFPSTSPDAKRGNNDLGRFGLGMKTASFSQTRKFTVLSRKKNSDKFSARTWDLDVLISNQWKIIVNSDEEITDILSGYETLSNNYLNEFTDFKANTIVVWYGLYKFYDFIREVSRTEAFKTELTEVTSEHLELVFHRFMERKETPVAIRINNKLLKGFNPFPLDEKDFRLIEYKKRKFGDDSIKMEGYVLPSRSISEVKQGQTRWTTRNRSLMDMEGIYVYRLDRIILFGGWNGLLKKAPRLQLARLQVEIGNNSDDKLHLNVAKSQMIIPHDLKHAFMCYVSELKDEAEREYHNKGIKIFPDSRKVDEGDLFVRNASNKGTLLELNQDFSILTSLQNEMSQSQLAQLRILIKMINMSINKIRKAHEDTVFLGKIKEDDLSSEDLLLVIKKLKKSGLTNQFIKDKILPKLGFKIESLPAETLEELM